LKSCWKGAKRISCDSAAIDKRKGILCDIWCGFDADDELLCKTVVLFSPCTVNYCSLLVPTDASIIYFTVSGFCMFRLVAILRELTTKLLNIDSNKLVLVLRSNMVQQNVKISIFNAPKHQNYSKRKCIAT